jgi:hypothetical protein
MLNQRLLGSTLRSPAKVVACLGAVQAQDYTGAKWAVGLRGKGITDSDVERAFDRGEILRTHVLRPTWHFVTPADIRWMLALTGPRIRSGCASRFCELELDGPTLARSARVMERALRDGRALTRAELALALRSARIDAAGQRLAYLLLSAELDGIICSGPRRGRQLTYALLELRVPAGPRIAADDALARLTRRYFASHGPATLRDYAWWAGLTMGDAKAGVARVRPALETMVRGGLTYYWRPSPPAPHARSEALLLPNWDEYVIAYADRRHVLAAAAGAGPREIVFAHTLVVHGRIVGTWKRSLNGRAPRIDVFPNKRVSAPTASAVRAAVDRYRDFLGVEKASALVHPRGRKDYSGKLKAES